MDSVYRIHQDYQVWKNCFQYLCKRLCVGPGETDGVQYHFVTVEKFKEEVEKGCFIEWAVYSGNHYGTTIQALNDLKEKVCVFFLCFLFFFFAWFLLFFNFHTKRVKLEFLILIWKALKQ